MVKHRVVCVECTRPDSPQESLDRLVVDVESTLATVAEMGDEETYDLLVRCHTSLGLARAMLRRAVTRLASYPSQKP